MWLSERAAGKKESAAQIGVATIGGEAVGVSTELERRNLKLCAPGGYFWRPRAGESLLIIKCGGEDGESCVAGAQQGGAPEGMENGEVYITSAAGAALWLRNDGRILMTGDLYLNGQKVEINDED